MEGYGWRWSARPEARWGFQAWELGGAPDSRTQVGRARRCAAAAPDHQGRADRGRSAGSGVACLLEQFGVSRPTLREAFRVLEAEGLISVRRGAHGGARVHPPNDDVAARYAGLILEHRGTTVADVYQASAILEPPCAALVARKRTPGDLKELREVYAPRRSRQRPAASAAGGPGCLSPVAGQAHRKPDMSWCLPACSATSSTSPTRLT